MLWQGFHQIELMGGPDLANLDEQSRHFGAEELTLGTSDTDVTGFNGRSRNYFPVSVMHGRDIAAGIPKA
jgi:hypothetical protein